MKGLSFLPNERVGHAQPARKATHTFHSRLISEEEPSTFQPSFKTHMCTYSLLSLPLYSKYKYGDLNYIIRMLPLSYSPVGFVCFLYLWFTFLQNRWLRCSNLCPTRPHSQFQFSPDYSPQMFNTTYTPTMLLAISHLVT